MATCFTEWLSGCKRTTLLRERDTFTAFQSSMSVAPLCFWCWQPSQSLGFLKSLAPTCLTRNLACAESISTSSTTQSKFQELPGRESKTGLSTLTIKCWPWFSSRIWCSSGSTSSLRSRLLLHRYRTRKPYCRPKKVIVSWLTPISKT